VVSQTEVVVGDSLCDADEGGPLVEAVRLWRAGQVAELYGVDESTVHRWERCGRLRPARRDPGGTKYWLAAEVLGDATAPEPEPVASPLSPAAVAELAAASRRPHRRRAS
jgi:hypothetical protein